ncbi:MAG: hypothetical protein A2901_07780 [Elusimicrobia bacterium RIFCSPLOWO2_01_FULL_54_10]|nr:MAG: hypothetical protein A2901_07780 [Elusimicrobia bacterium RIFCSPLOWO2_01_FULL_54_10]
MTLDIHDGDTWPRWPLLPLIERGGAARAGIMIDGHGFAVYLGNVFSGLESADPVVRYDSAEDLLAEWRID